MDHDAPNQRARKLIAAYHLTDADVRQIIGVARLQLATFDPEYRANVSQLAIELDRSRPTLYSWADQALAATVAAFRSVRVGRPLKRLHGQRTGHGWSVATDVRYRDVRDGT